MAILRYTREEIAGTVEHSVKSRRAERRKRQNFCSIVIPTDVTPLLRSPFSSLVAFTGCCTLHRLSGIGRGVLDFHRLRGPTTFNTPDSKASFPVVSNNPHCSAMSRSKVAFPSSERLFIRLKINPLPSLSLFFSSSVRLCLSLSRDPIFKVYDRAFRGCRLQGCRFF